MKVSKRLVYLGFLGLLSFKLLGTNEVPGKSSNVPHCSEPFRAPRVKLRYPTTGRVSSDGFSEFLQANLQGSRSNLSRFSHELQQEFGAGFLTLVNSGSSANLVAAAAVADLHGKGHAVAAGFTFPTTLSSLITTGFEVSLVDVKAGGFTMDPESLLKAIRPDTKLIVVTHFLGFPADLSAIAKIARSRNIAILQDACETMHLQIEGKQAHEYGDFTTWSFYHPHHLSAYGGGAVVSNSENDFRVTESIAHWGRACSCQVDPNQCTAPEGMNHNFWYERIGFNVEMSELNAAFGRFQLQTFSEQETERSWRYETLYSKLKDLGSVVVYPAPETGGTPFVFPITLKAGTAREASQFLAREGVEVRSLMGGSIAEHPAFRSLEHDGLEHARDMGERSFFVGIHQTLPREDVEAVAAILQKVLGE